MKVRPLGAPTDFGRYISAGLCVNDTQLKVEEINTKAEEEFNVEKMRLVREQCAKYLVEWNAKKKKSDRIRKVDNSSTKSKGRLVLLQAMNDHVARVVNETRKNLVYITGKESRYKPFLERLILQGLYRLLDKDVVLSCRQKDEPLVRAAIPVAVKQFRKRTGIQANVAVDTENWLGEQSCGGVVLTSLQGRKKVVNTLAARLELIAQHTVPEIRAALFGANKHRKYTS
ncbi:hypothetical protein HPB51_010137 [Rhipicephalus microplus]|uniref:Uncharacterized protein n=1 Tax=Rhipicephalus microplus TaxID=6941 RepID=A0A9J6F204_RHIMP|nr:hypothetical protein HPB51_010137 [Rhipicephalus microplus]